jgi:hypothetical protein
VHSHEEMLTVAVQRNRPAHAEQTSLGEHRGGANDQDVSCLPCADYVSIHMSVEFFIFQCFIDALASHGPASWGQVPAIPQHKQGNL